MKAIHYAQDASRLRMCVTLLDAYLAYKAQAIPDMHDPRTKAELALDSDVEMVRADICRQIDRLELAAIPQQAAE